MLAFVALTMLGALALGSAVAFALGIGGATWIIFVEGLDPSILARRVETTLASFPLLAVPLFIMIGRLAERCGMIPDLVHWLQLIVGRLRGGRAYLNVLNSMFFAGISGSAISDVAALGRLEIEMMRQSGYPVVYSAALTAASSMLGPIIPPSIAMVIFALAAGNVSIGGLFMASIVPGLLIGGCMLAMAWRRSVRDQYGVVLDRLPTSREFLTATTKVLPTLLLPLIIVGGVVGGIYTVTESAAIGFAYILLVGLVVQRRLRLSDIYDSIIYSASVSSVLGLLMAAGAITSWILVRNGTAQLLADYLSMFSTDPTVFLSLVVVVVLLLGMVMDATALIIALTPLLVPISRAYGIDDLHFGVVFVMTSMVGMITPPVGIILFITANLVKIRFEDLAREVLPFVVMIVAVIFLLVFVPELTLTLPKLVGFN